MWDQIKQLAQRENMGTDGDVATHLGHVAPRGHAGSLCVTDRHARTHA